jgi:DNA-binding transcriptional LysR family regulator
MTLAQLQSFVLVARHGSVKAAAAELEVTEPAVSVAVAALRKELGDELFVRSGRGIALTPGGQRLAALAGEILGLAEQARRSVAEPRRMVVAATHTVAEHVRPLLDAFRARHEGVELAVEPAPGASFADRLEHRRADIALGPAPGGATIAAAPFLRCRLVVVAAPGHPLAGRRSLAPADLAGERWLAGEPQLDSTTGTGLFLARHGLAPAEVVTCGDGAAALAAAAAGEGVALVLAHATRGRELVRLDVRGTPSVEIWHASTLGLGHALPAALALQRFTTTFDATQAIATGRAGTTQGHVRPKVHVTLWANR